MTSEFGFSAWALLAAVGCLSGVSAGLMGIGGGLIVVPSLIYGLPLLGLSGAEIPKIATATSLALVVPTALASAQAHAAKGAVNLRLAVLLAPAIVAGSFLASTLSRFLDARMIVFIFVIYAIIFAWGLLKLSKSHTADAPSEHKARELVSIGIKSVSGGALASLLGMGGGFFCVPILSRFVPIKTAIGTSSALGLPLAAAGVVGYLLAPSPVGCTSACAGAIFVPAVGAIGVAAVLTAPLGARLAHILPVPVLKRVFASMLLLTALDLTHKIMPPIPAAQPGLKTLVLRFLDPACRSRGDGQLTLRQARSP